MKTRKILSAFLVCVMIVCAMSVTAFAETEVANFGDLKTALTNAANGDVIKLSSDITATEAIKATDVIIDLCGNTLQLADNSNNYLRGTTTIKNGTISVNDVQVAGDCIMGIGDRSNDATVKFENVNITGSNYSSAFAVLMVYGDSTLNIENGEWTLSNEQSSAGGVIKSEDGASNSANVNITGTKMTFNNISRGISGSTAVLDGVEMTITGGDNGINGAALTVKNSTLNISGGTGRALTVTNYDVVIENSTLNFSNNAEADIRFKTANELTMDNSSTLSNCTVFANAEGAKINGTEVTGTEEEPSAVTVKNGETTIKPVVKGLSGEGTEASPYLINNIDELKWFRDHVNTFAQDGSSQYQGKFIKLTADIDLKGEEWEPIGSCTADHGSFYGTFDGDGHTIFNLNITNYGKNGAGFFSKVSGSGDGPRGTVKNLTIHNINIESQDYSYVGGVIANGGGNSCVSNVHVTGDVYIDGYGYVGGIVGHGYPDIDNCSVVAEDGSWIHSYYWCAGGIIGYAGEGGTIITNSSVKGIDVWSAYGGAAAVVGLLQDGNTLTNVSAENVEVTSASDYCMGYIAGNGEASTLTNVTVTNVTATANGNPITTTDAVASVGNKVYFSFAEALNAVADGDTITMLNATGDESAKEIDFTKDISFTITGSAPNYALPVVTFQNANVTIKDAKILIPELDARQNATINVVDSTVHDAGGNSIVKSYYNGAINISGTSVVYTMQVTTMGYITISDTAKLNATWQTNVYGNGMITVEDNATFASGALQLIAKDYSGRDNTDADRVGKPATIVVDGATLTVGKVYSDSGADYSYNSSHGINIGTIDGKSAVLDIKNGATVNFFMANGEIANIGANGTVNVNSSKLNTICRTENGTVTLANNGTINVYGTSTLKIDTLTGSEIKLHHNAIIKDSTVGGEAMLYGKVTFSGDNTFAMLYDFGNAYSTDSAEWIIEKGASVTLTEKARYGLGYGDKATVYGNIEDALTARESLTEDDISFFTHGLVGMSSWDVKNSLKVKDAYVVIGSNNSFGNTAKSGYKGTYDIDFDNSVLDSSRITFYESESKTDFSFVNSDVEVGTFMTRDADSTFTLTNTKLLSTTTTNGTDEGNYHAGTMTLTNSNLTYSAPLVMENGIFMLVSDSSLTAPKITGTGKISIDASNFDGTEIQIITADMSGYTGTVEVTGNEKAIYEITETGLVVKVIPELPAILERSLYVRYADYDKYDFDGDGVKENSIKFSMFAGIDSLNYSEVGFDVTINGENASIPVTVVYDTVTTMLNGKEATIPASEFGYNSKYVFGYTIHFPVNGYDNKTITWTPYSKGKNGKTTGSTFSLNDIYTTTPVE